MEHPYETQTQKKSRFPRFGGRASTETLLTIIAAAVVVMSLVLLTKMVANNELITQKPKGDKYQAVFLTNGQVYFGKLSGVGGPQYVLKDVYLIQSQQGGASPSPSPTAAGNLTLAKLEQNSLIKPEQEMVIARDSVLFWENMNDDAEVVKKIKEEKGK